MKTVCDLLNDLGIGTAYRGYGIAADAAGLCARDHGAFRCLRQRVYQPLGQARGITAMAVERDLRTLAEAAWRRGRGALEHMARCELSAPPSAGQLLAILAQGLEEATPAGALLNRLGLDLRYEGYDVIREALALGLGEESAFRCMRTGVYIPLGRRCGRRPRAIERSIRTAARRIWQEQPAEICRIARCELEAAPSPAMLLDILLTHLTHHGSRKP